MSQALSVGLTIEVSRPMSVANRRRLHRLVGLLLGTSISVSQLVRLDEADLFAPTSELEEAEMFLMRGSLSQVFFSITTNIYLLVAANVSGFKISSWRAAFSLIISITFSNM
jgi:hypothetical protein